MCMNIGYAKLMQMQSLKGENIVLDLMMKAIAVKIKMNYVTRTSMMEIIEMNWIESKIDWN